MCFDVFWFFWIRSLFLILFLFLYTITSCPLWNDSVWMATWSLCRVFPYRGAVWAVQSCLCVAPHRSTAVWMDRGSVKQSSNKATADEHLCVNGFGTGSLKQGRVKVKAEMREREEKKAERGWDELSHYKCSRGGLEELKCEWQGPMNSALESLQYPLWLQAPWLASLSHPGLWPLETFVLQLSLPEYKRVFSVRVRLLGQWV